MLRSIRPKRHRSYCRLRLVGRLRRRPFGGGISSTAWLMRGNWWWPVRSWGVAGGGLARKPWKTRSSATEAGDLAQAGLMSPPISPHEPTAFSAAIPPCFTVLRGYPGSFLSPRMGASARSQGRQPRENGPPSPAGFPPSAAPTPGDARGWGGGRGNGCGGDPGPGADAPGYVLTPLRGFPDSLLHHA